MACAKFVDIRLSAQQDFVETPSVQKSPPGFALVKIVGVKDHAVLDRRRTAWPCLVLSAL